MNDPTQFDPSQLPSLKSLHLSALAVLLAAPVVVLTIVLPAETGNDPTGLGEWLGLTRLGEIKAHADPAPDVVPVLAPDAEVGFRTDETAVVLQPGEGAEVKAQMRTGDQLIFSWSASTGPVFFDFHGEREGAPANEFTSYAKGTETAAEGGFEATFDGVHGWYWKNTGAQAVTVRLNTSGVYKSIGRK